MSLLAHRHQRPMPTDYHPNFKTPGGGDPGTPSSRISIPAGHWLGYQLGTASSPRVFIKILGTSPELKGVPINYRQMLALPPEICCPSLAPSPMILLKSTLPARALRFMATANRLPPQET